MLMRTRRKLLLMSARNKFVTEGLQSAYSTETDGGELQAVCVSNKLYRKHIETGDHPAVYASGIPDLRQRCHSVTAASRYREAKNLLITCFPSLLNSLQIWIGSSEDEPRPIDKGLELLDHICQLKDHMDDAVTDLRVAIMESFEEQIGAMFAHRSEHWESIAEDEERKYEQWHWMSYKAFCRNYGTHSTAAVGAHRWNARFIWKMRAELEQPWEILESDVPEIFAALGKAVSDSSRSTMDKARPYDPRLATSLRLQFTYLQYQLGLVEESCMQNLRTLRRAASEDTASSFVLRSMLATYRNASAQSGSGMSMRQKSIVRGRLGPEELFPDINRLIKERMEAVVKEAEQMVRQQIRRRIRAVRNDLQLALAKTRESDEAQRPKRELRGKLEDWKKALDKIVSELN